KLELVPQVGLVRNADALPPISARFAKLPSPTLSPPELLNGAPTFCPVMAVNCANANSVAIVVSSLMTICPAVASWPQGPSAAISPIAEFFPAPASPPIATTYVSETADGQVNDASAKSPLASVTALASALAPLP